MFHQHNREGNEDSPAEKALLAQRQDAYIPARGQSAHIPAQGQSAHISAQGQSADIPAQGQNAYIPAQVAPHRGLFKKIFPSLWSHAFTKASWCLPFLHMTHSICCQLHLAGAVQVAPASS